MLPKTKIANVQNCSFSSWYNQFRKVTIRSVIVALPPEFLSYLLEDGIVLPSGSYPEPTYDRNSDESSDDEVDWGAADKSEAKAPSFPELEAEIKSAIDELGGSVFPKLNWSSPKDAKWITADHTLQCSSLGEVFLLLKSSDFVTHDLTQPFKDCVDLETNDNEEPPNDVVSYELVLRKWVDINPGTEFRCFVKNDVLVAACQRDYTNYYEHISSRQAQITQEILSFFNENINGKFADSDYVFDIYQVTKDCIKLLDFNPFGATTDPLLFEWEELWRVKIGSGKAPEFRCVTSYSGVQPSPYSYYTMPVDFLDLSTGQDSYKMIDFLQLINGKSDYASTSSSESEDETSTTAVYPPS